MKERINTFPLVNKRVFRGYLYATVSNRYKAQYLTCLKLQRMFNALTTKLILQPSIQQRKL